MFAVSTQRFVDDGNGNVSGLVLAEVDESFKPIAGTEREIPAQLVLLAMGFVGPEKNELINGLGVELDQRGNVARNDDWQTSVSGVFTCGDMGRG